MKNKYRNPSQEPQKLLNIQPEPNWTKGADASSINQDHRAITAKQLRDELFDAVTADGGESMRCHTIKESKYGEIISTSSVTGIKVITDDKGNQHIIILTN